MYRVAREWKVCWGIWTDLSSCFLQPLCFRMSFDGWSLADPDSCSQIRDQETTRQDTGMLGLSHCFRASAEKVFTVEIRDSLQWENCSSRFLNAMLISSEHLSYPKILSIYLPSCHSRRLWLHFLEINRRSHFSSFQLNTNTNKVMLSYYKRLKMSITEDIQTKFTGLTNCLLGIISYWNNSYLHCDVTLCTF